MFIYLNNQTRFNVWAIPIKKMPIMILLWVKFTENRFDAPEATV